MNIWLMIVNGVFEILQTIVSILPDINTSLNSNIGTFLVDFKTKIAPINYIFPVNTFFTVFGFILLLEGIIFSYKLILWISAHVTAGFVKH